MRFLLSVLPVIIFASSCTVSKQYNPARKFSPEELKEDYTIFRNILEESHPSLYWYTPKDSIDYYFEVGLSKLSDSMPEYKFRSVLSYVASKFRCGHTSIIASKEGTEYTSTARSFSFPLSIKAWPDTVMVTGNLNRKDTIVKRGAILKSIEGRPIQTIVDSFFSHLSADGFNTTHKYQTISNGGVFRNMYGSIYGLRLKMNVEFIDSSGLLRQAVLDVYNPSADTPRLRFPARVVSKSERRNLILQANRNLHIDTALNTAFMEVNSFARNVHLRNFFKRSFREIKKQHIQNLVIDVRGNGGGSVVLSNLLSKYISRKPFKIADSQYAITKKSSYKKYIDEFFQNWIFMVFMTRKRNDGLYHFGLYEGKYFKPRSSNHFDGNIYVLTGGNTFSAASLFTKTVKNQPNVTIVGEETGGSAYGNTAWLIPDVTLPRTGVRFRLPLFRLVVDKDETRGRGVMPDVESDPNMRDIMRNADYKMEKVIQLIKEKSSSSQ